MADPRPSGLRLELGRRLRVIRDQAGLTGPQLAERLGCTQSRISRIENGKISTSIVGYTDWLDACGVVDQTQRARVTALAEGVIHGLSAYRELGRGSLGIRQRELIDMDSHASTLRQFSPLIMPGLLHTPSYARACIEASNFGAVPDLDAAVSIRMRRGARLLVEDRKDVPRFHALVTEAALRWVPANTDNAVGELLRHVLDVARSPNIVLQVITTGTPMRSLPQCSFMVVDWRDPDEDPIVIVETPAAELTFVGHDEVSDFETQWRLMLDVALGPNESLAFVARLAEEYPAPRHKGGRPRRRQNGQGNTTAARGVPRVADRHQRWELRRVVDWTGRLGRRPRFEE